MTAVSAETFLPYVLSSAISQQFSAVVPGDTTGQRRSHVVDVKLVRASRAETGTCGSTLPQAAVDASRSVATSTRSTLPCWPVL